MNSTNHQILKPEQGMFELSLMNAEALSYQFDDIVVETLNRGIPPELVTRLKELWEKTKVVAGETIAIGKIIVKKIVEFLMQNPKLTIGMAIGAVLTVLTGGVSGIPWIGAYLQPLATWAAATTAIYIAGVGAAMENGDYSGSPITAAITLADKFFELLKSILGAVTSYLAAD